MGTYKFRQGTKVQADAFIGDVQTATGVSRLPVQEAVEVTFETETGAIINIPAGELWGIREVVTFTTVAWDGSGAALDVGIVDGDTDGLIDGANLDAMGVKGGNADERGALLWDAANGHPITAIYMGPKSIGVVVTPGTDPTAGTTYVIVEGWRVPSPS